MPTINVAELGDAFVIYFDTEGERINAYTLASTLVGIADAAKAANNSINLGYDIEIVVEAIGPGSFRAMLRAIYKESRNLFSAESARAIILNVIAAVIMQHACSTNPVVRVDVNTDEVVIDSGANKLIIPRHVYDSARVAEQNPQFVRAIGKTVDCIASDDAVHGLGFAPNMDSPRPDFVIPQDTLRAIDVLRGSDPLTRVIPEQADLQIVKAILEQSDRKWEFMWRGVKISAPVLDNVFYARFTAHEITIAPGDGISAKLLIKQALDPTNGIYTNVGYVVAEVYAHIPRMRQTSLPYAPPE